MFGFKRRKFNNRGVLDLSGSKRGSLLGITCAGKHDGGGAQVHAVMSALLFSRATKVPYFHSPFRSVPHGDQPEALANRWEAAFNLGLGSPGLPEGVPVITGETFNNGYRGAPAIVAEPHFHGFAEGKLDLYATLADEFRARLALPRRTFATATIAVHVRRGDIVGDPAYAMRLTGNDIVLRNIQRVQRDHPRHRVVIFSEGVEADFQPLAGICEFELYSDVFATISGLIEADCLIMAKSSLSYVAGLLSRGSVYYEPFWHGPLPSWRVLPKAR